ncbi:MAG: ATP-binding cassette domain-containing protein [Desulfobacterota bacterium]|nr:ATP-binding cassette domain-containing protein [Thermodesulfobacteriota bacterium]
MEAIVTHELTKHYAAVTAVNKVSLRVMPGEVFGLLGPNGAGKTTFIKMLATLTTPSSGDAVVCGHRITQDRDAVRRCIGMVFQDPALDDRLTGRENLDFHARMYGMKRDDRMKRLTDVLELVGLAEKADVLVKQYSGGMKRRLEIARGLMHFPKVLFLDEPTLGLDPQTRYHIWEYIRQLNAREAVTVILTTHYMEEADALCSRIGIIDYGTVITVDTPAVLKNSIGHDIVTIEATHAELLRAALEKEPWIQSVTVSDSTIVAQVREAEQKVARAVFCAQEVGAQVRSITVRKPSLEDVFLHYTGKRLRDDALDIREQRRGGHP